MTKPEHDAALEADRKEEAERINQLCKAAHEAGITSPLTSTTPFDPEGIDKAPEPEPNPRTPPSR